MKTGDRGQVLIVVALAIVALVGFAALAVDVAYLITVRNELQRCADSGALAGASRWIEPGSLPWSDSLVRSEAESRAKNFASTDPVVQTHLDRDLEVFVEFPQDNQIRVETRRNVDLFFAPIFGIWNQEYRAFARARSYYRTTPPPPGNFVQLVE
jgi:hypothetical protein